MTGPSLGETTLRASTDPLDGEARRADQVAGLLEAMTLREKVAQMTQVEFGSITPDQVAEWAIGSVLSGGGGNHGDGRAAAWRAGVSSYVEGSRRSRLGIPILYGTDAVHGHNNVHGATIFPHNLGLGATRDPELVRAIARAAALETAATGARWSFAPCLGVPQDPRWGRTYEGFAEDPAVVAALGRAAVEGWHGRDMERNGVLACAKHFVGEGAMGWGTAGRHRHPWTDWWDGWGEDWQIDQGDITIDEPTLRADHLAPFVAAIDAGVSTIMACYASWRGERIHAHQYLLTEVLKGELGFSGFVVSDWMGVDQIAADRAVAVERALLAGVDMVMVPFDFQGFITTVEDLVGSGRVPIERIDDATRRILGAKAQLGLLDHAGVPRPARCDVDRPAPPIDVVGCDRHRALARRAAAASTVVITNDGALPVTVDDRVVAAGQALDDIGIACGGWTIAWEGGTGAITHGQTILDGLRTLLGSDRITYDPAGKTGRGTVGVVAVHELPYVEGGGDRADLVLPADQVELVRRVRTRVERLIVVVISGRPLIIDSIVDEADAIVACWLPGSEADGVADVLAGRVPTTGTLPISWPHLMSEPRLPVGTRAASWPVGHRAAVEGEAQPAVS